MSAMATTTIAEHAQLHCLHAPMKPRPVRFAYDDYTPRLYAGSDLERSSRRVI